LYEIIHNLQSEGFPEENLVNFGSNNRLKNRIFENILSLNCSQRQKQELFYHINNHGLISSIPFHHIDGGNPDTMIDSANTPTAVQHNPANNHTSSGNQSGTSPTQHHPPKTAPMLVCDVNGRLSFVIKKR